MSPSVGVESLSDTLGVGSLSDTLGVGSLSDTLGVESLSDTPESREHPRAGYSGKAGAGPTQEHVKQSIANPSPVPTASIHLGLRLPTAQYGQPGANWLVSHLPAQHVASSAARRRRTIVPHDRLIFAPAHAQKSLRTVPSPFYTDKPVLPGPCVGLGGDDAVPLVERTRGSAPDRRFREHRRTTPGPSRP